MNLTKRQTFYLLLFILVLILFITMFSTPAYLDYFYISSNDASNAGTTIGGITTPLVGLFSAILLYLTLNKQSETIKQQEVKNEIDLIFSLISQLHLEISYFYHTETKKSIGELPQELKYSGVEAFHKFVHLLTSENYLDHFQHKLYSFYQTKQLLLFLRSFSLIEDKITKNTVINKHQKTVFNAKINDIYTCLFKESLENLVSTIEKHDSIQDDAFYEIKNFISNH